MLWLSLLIAVVIVACRLLSGDTPTLAAQSTTLLHGRKLAMPANNDSWGAMLSALQRTREASTTSVYQRSLELDQCKYQYPPSSLLLLEVLGTPEAQVSCTSGGQLGARLNPDNWPAKRWIDWALRLATLATIAVSIQIVIERLGPLAMRGAGASSTLWGVGFAMGLVYYPLMNGYHLGQVQVFLNLFIALALWCWWRGRLMSAGVLIGLCCLFKPQYAVLLLWAGVRREWRFFAGLAAVAAAGHGLAVLRYGVAMHLHYLELLSLLSQRGEAYWANQTVNGLLNRLLMTASPTQFEADSFPAYNPIVRWGTLVSSITLIGAALWPMRGPADRERKTLDLALAIAALTIASPIGWQHHYGCFFPIFGLALTAMLLRPTPVAAQLALGGAFLIVANSMLRDDLFFVNRIAGLFGSHMWVGAMVLLCLMFWLRGRSTGPASVQAAGGDSLRPSAAAPRTA